jgi:hypothetical protein
MQPPIRIRVDESMEVDMPTGEPEQIIAFEVRFPVLAIDDAAREMVGQSEQQAFDQ